MKLLEVVRTEQSNSDVVQVDFNDHDDGGGDVDAGHDAGHDGNGDEVGLVGWVGQVLSRWACTIVDTLMCWKNLNTMYYYV